MSVLSELFVHRYLCTVLEEMRDSARKLNHINMWRYKKYMPMLIEEAQTLANRMEAALDDKKDLEKLHKERSKLKKEIKTLLKEKEELEDNDNDS